ncbi:hypothetical protein HMI56_001170, partial [Coelomomyces lativittatus]
MSASSSATSLSTSSLLSKKSSSQLLALLKSRNPSLSHPSPLLLKDERIILDIGPHVTKIGYAGETSPRFVFENHHSCGFLPSMPFTSFWSWPLNPTTFPSQFYVQL